mgnify:CR=1 FL=1
MLKLQNILFKESFTYPPRDKKLFFSNLAKRIGAFKLKIENYNKLFLLGKDEDDLSEKKYVLSGVLRQATDSRLDDYDLKYAIKELVQLSKELKEDELLRMFEQFKKENAYYRAKYIGWIIQSIENFIEDTKAPLQKLKEFSGYDYISAFNDGYDSYKEYLPMINSIEIFIKDCEEFKNYILSSLQKLKRLSRIISNYSDEELKQENIEPIEILYHTTINAKQLFSSGFKQNFNQSVEGIGGSNVDKSGKPSISFTSDLFVAKEIMRCLKEAMMIAKGQLDIYDIKTWAKQEKIDDEIVKGFGGYEDKKIENKKLTSQEVFNYYRYYLAYSKRYDPVFFDTNNIMEVFKSKNIDDIGILVCRVDMTNPNIAYYSSMEEYRVPPSSVIKIEKVLSS